MIYYSHRTRKALAEGRLFLPFGFAHYSYGSLCQKFVKLFKDGGLKSQEVIMPEIYANAAHLSVPEGGRLPVHIAFKPFEEFRLLKGAANIAYVAWEFDKLPSFEGMPFDHPRRDNILNDYVHVLSLASEIWVGCEYTKAVFASQGLNRVEVIPAPIGVERGEDDAETMSAARKIGCLEFTRKAIADCIDSTETPWLDSSTLFRADDCRAAGGRVFVSVFNPGDPRKNVAALFLGFQEYLRRSKRNDLLIVKLVLDGSPESLRNALSKQLPKYFDYAGVPMNFIDCSNILLVPERLSTEAMGILYRAADFYVCTSAAEGQGLPVQEAMAEGLVPISSAETAMADYIKPNHAIVMQTKPAPIPLQVSNAYALWGLSWRLVDHHEVAAALQRAADLPGEEYTRRSRAARDFIIGEYGFDAIRGKMLQRIKELTA
jgi:glycosyltransferase involved in cell wall biosynthesis